MRYSGCLLEYRLASVNEIELLRLDPPESSEDWPYLGYPEILPYHQLELIDTAKCSWSEFAEAIPNAAPSQPSDLFVAVPPPMTIGCSLWGRSGDEEGVVIAWELNVTSKKVVAYNLCT